MDFLERPKALPEPIFFSKSKVNPNVIEVRFVIDTSDENYESVLERHVFTMIRRALEKATK